MIDKVTAVPVVLERLASLPEGHALDLRSYKRDRSVVMVRMGPDRFEVLEDGFGVERFQSDFKGMRRILKTVLKREFPRSTKLRLYVLGAWSGRVPTRGRI